MVEGEGLAVIKCSDSKPRVVGISSPFKLTVNHQSEQSVTERIAANTYFPAIALGSKGGS